MTMNILRPRASLTLLAAAVLAAGLMALVGAKPAWAAERSFAPAPKSPFQVGSSPGSVTNADFDGDGNVDLATSNFGSNNISVLLGDGGGDFQAATNSPFTMGTGLTSVISADFNDDTFADLAVANRRSNNVWVLLGKGGGDFQAATNSPIAVGVEPTSVITGHFNADSFVDLAVSNYGDGTVSVLLGQDLNGDGKDDGTFQQKTDYLIYQRTCNDFLCVNNTGGPNQVIAADFNGDATVDLATANLGICILSCDPGGVSVLLGNGNGTFQNAKLATSGIPTIPSIDANGSGNIVATYYNSDVVSVLSYNGNGNFFVAGTFPVGDGPWSVNSADLNGDSVDDLAVANFNSDNVSVLWGSGGSFQAAKNFPAGDGPDFVIGANFNADSFADLAVANNNSHNVSVLLNTAPTNTAPSADDKTVETDENAAKTITLSGTDADGDELTFQITDAPDNGSLANIGSPTCTGTNCSADVTYTPDNGYSGPDTFAYEVEDGSGGTDTATVSITVNAVNDPPDATDNSYTVTENRTLSVSSPGVLSNDTDLNGDPLTVAAPRPLSGPSHGTLTLNTVGSFTYMPNTNFEGMDSFTYKATDGSQSSDAATVSITVRPDTTKPRVTAATPTGTLVKRNANLTATFTERMKTSTITTSTFKLFKVNTNGTKTQVTNVTLALSADGLKSTLNPSGASSTLLAANTKYQGVITTGAQDLAGNALDQNATTTGNQQKTWNFTTGSS